MRNGCPRGSPYNAQAVQVTSDGRRDLTDAIRHSRWGDSPGLSGGGHDEFIIVLIKGRQKIQGTESNVRMKAKG